MIGRFYLDLHPRPGKYNHAANFGIRNGVEGIQIPEGALICNFARADLARCGSTIFVVCFVLKIPPCLRGNPRPCQISTAMTNTNATAPNVAPSEMPGGWLGLRLL